MTNFVHTAHQFRALAFAYGFLVIGVHLWQLRVPWWTFALLALQFVAYPQLAHLRVRRAGNPKDAEMKNQYLDALLLGAWCAGLGFPTWITYSCCSATALNAAINRGVAGAGNALGAFSCGVLVAVVVLGLKYWPTTSTLVTTLCFAGSLGYVCAMGILANRLSRDLAALAHIDRRSRDRIGI